VPDPFDRRVVEIDRTGGFGLVRERLIERRTVPVRIRHFVVGTCGNQQLPLPIVRIREGVARLVKVEREASFEAGGDLRVGALPASPLRERAHARQVVGIRQLLELEIGERRRRLANRKPRVASAFDQCDTPAAFQERERRERSTEA
jgi:hypothetical protein